MVVEAQMTDESIGKVKKFWLLHSLSIILFVGTVISAGFWSVTEVGQRWNELSGIMFSSTFAALLMTFVRKYTWEKDSNDDAPPAVKELLPEEC